MRFTNLIRDSIARAVMADVPSVDYVERVRSIVNRENLILLNSLRISLNHDRLCLRHIYIMNSCFVVYGLTEAEHNKIKNLPEVTVCAEAFQAQVDERRDLYQSINSAMRSVKTRKEAVEAFPEFEKYYPKIHLTVRSLPTLTNVVSDFVKAGWPVKQGTKCKP